jgi:hypothetical protein
VSVKRLQLISGTTFARDLGRETSFGRLKSDEHFVIHWSIDNDISFDQQSFFFFLIHHRRFSDKSIIVDRIEHH